MFQQTNKGILIKIKVIPKSSKNEVLFDGEEELKIKLKAVPQKGEANEELIEYLSEVLKIGKSKIELVKGSKSRHKTLCISDISIQYLKDNLINKGTHEKL